MIFSAKNNLALFCSHVSKTFAINRGSGLRAALFGLKSDHQGPRVEALRDINLEVPRGKIVGILGRNGAGKSTLLRLLGQVYTPSSGYIEVLGLTAGLFELGGFGNANLVGREYALRYLQLVGAPSTQLNELLGEIAEFSELDDAFDHPIRTYSSGMAARLYFAVATAYQHEIYLIDELLSVGDEHFQSKCWRRMRERLLGGASGVLVTHDWTAIVKLCEQACVIEDGIFTYSGPSDGAVVSYLKLTPLSATSARFSNTLPSEYLGHSGFDLKIIIPVEILKFGSTSCSISIEMMRIGVGWEIIMLSPSVVVGENIGDYLVSFEILDLPLAPGNYSLNLFLTHSQSNEGDVRSWTYGNGLSLKIEGAPSRTAVRLPFVAKRLNEE